METKAIRSRAWASLTGNWGVSIGVAALAALLGGLLIGKSFLPSIHMQIPIHIPILEEISTELSEGIRLGNFTFSLRSGIFGLAAFLLGGTLQLGYARFLLKQQDGQHPEFNELFSQFDRFGTGFAQHFLRSLYTGLWTLLFIIPGIIKGYSYAMTPFILSDHPELTASQAIDRSKSLMDGHKMDLFILELTFLGWDILAALTMNLGYLALNPYKNAAHAVFYRQILKESQNRLP